VVQGAGRKGNRQGQNPATQNFSPPPIFGLGFCDFLSAIGRKLDELKNKENVT
jgi:hypothetical protein